MNDITKKSYYSFLKLYLISSFLFLLTACYLYFALEQKAINEKTFYKLSHIADQVSSEVINAHMMQTHFELKDFKDVKVALYDGEWNLKYGSIYENVDFSKQYRKYNDTDIYLSTATVMHLGIAYVVVQSRESHILLEELLNTIIISALFASALIIIISVFLSRMFLKPIKEKMQEVETFVKDTTHELNTPITALMMSVKKLKNKKEYDEKTVQNISISSKQLYEIYSSLSFLSFDVSEEDKEIEFNEVVKESINYFAEILEKKKITVILEDEKTVLKIAPTKARMLINNLLSNAIKYSHPNSQINIKITKEYLSVEDNGIGIEKDKLEQIFERFTRANSYAGGFGVGLSIVEGISKEYGFRVDVKSEINKGSRFSICFY
jgi:two-component system OmpR family sensor kinase